MILMGHSEILCVSTKTPERCCQLKHWLVLMQWNCCNPTFAPRWLIGKSCPQQPPDMFSPLYVLCFFFYDSSRVLRNKRPHRKRKNFHAPPLPQFQCWLVRKRGTCILTSSGVYFAGPEHSKNNNPSTLKLGGGGGKLLDRFCQRAFFSQDTEPRDFSF